MGNAQLRRSVIGCWNSAAALNEGREGELWRRAVEAGLVQLLPGEGFARRGRQGPDGLVTFHDLAIYVTLRARSRSLETGHVQVPYEAGEASGDFLLARIGAGGGPSVTPGARAAAVIDNPPKPGAVKTNAKDGGAMCGYRLEVSFWDVRPAIANATPVKDRRTMFRLQKDSGWGRRRNSGGVEEICAGDGKDDAD